MILDIFWKLFYWGCILGWAFKKFLKMCFTIVIYIRSFCAHFLLEYWLNFCGFLIFGPKKIVPTTSLLWWHVLYIKFFIGRGVVLMPEFWRSWFYKISTFLNFFLQKYEFFHQKWLLYLQNLYFTIGFKWIFYLK